MPVDPHVYIYNNDGTVLLKDYWCSIFDYYQIVSNGIIFTGNGNTVYTYTGTGTFAGIAKIVGANEPIYPIGSIFYPHLDLVGEIVNYYIVEETIHGTSKILIDGVGIDLTADTVTANKMLSGFTAHDSNGDIITGSIPGKAAQTYTPSTSDQTITSGQYLSGAQTIKGDANLVAGNIKSGVTIFGKAGTLQPAKIEQSKTLTLGTSAPTTIMPDSGKVLSSVPVVLDTSVIKAENIVKDVTMLGVTGTYEGAGYNLTIIANNNENLEVMSYKINDGTYTNFRAGMNVTIPNCKKVYLNGSRIQTNLYLNDGVNNVYMTTDSVEFCNYCIGLVQDITLKVYGSGPV